MQYKLITLITRDLSDWIRGQGTKAKARPRQGQGKAKAKPLRGQGQGHDLLSSSRPGGRGQSSRTPSLVPDEDTRDRLTAITIIFYSPASGVDKFNKKY